MIRPLLKHFLSRGNPPLLSRCPCAQHSMYGLAMVLCPSLFLLGLGLVASNGFWRTALTLNKTRSPGVRCNHCMKGLPSLFRPFLSATAFIVFALMKGDYYICVKAGPSGCLSDEVSGNVAQVHSVISCSRI